MTMLVMRSPATNCNYHTYLMTCSFKEYIYNYIYTYYYIMYMCVFCEYKFYT